jgi:hypothetical protein
MDADAGFLKWLEPHFTSPIYFSDLPISSCIWQTFCSRGLVMAQDKFKRKLTTIFCADMAGYSRLMGEDEAVTVITLELHQGIIFDLVAQHSSRVIDSIGDNLLVV